MKIQIISVCKNTPAWAKEALEEYLKRLPKHFKIDLIDLSFQRDKNSNIAKEMAHEGAAILDKVNTPETFLIALDEHGQELTSTALAQNFAKWQQNWQNIVFVIGGPDGLAQEVLTRANLIWALGKLTLPHQMARLVLVEQLYRATTILQGHPYHRQ